MTTGVTVTVVGGLLTIEERCPSLTRLTLNSASSGVEEKDDQKEHLLPEQPSLSADNDHDLSPVKLLGLYCEERGDGKVLRDQDS